MRRVCTPGIDLPAWFYHDLKGIDSKLEFVWQEFRTLYDDVMNSYTGSFEESRFNIHNELGQELWGFPLTDGHGNPIPENAWHIWRNQWPHGMCHVVKIENLDSGYLNILLSRLHLQANVPARKYQRRMAEEAEEKRLKEQKQTLDLMGDVQSANAGFFNKIKDNAARGLWAPTNPTRDQIISYPGQRNRSRIVRPLEDSEGGLVVPDHWKKA